jgi:hypothetical protein
MRPLAVLFFSVTLSVACSGSDGAAFDAGHDAGGGGMDSGSDGGASTGVPDAGIGLNETEWTPLLDDSLSRWYRWLSSKGRDNDPHGVFKMEAGGVLHVLGVSPTSDGEGFGYLATRDEFGNYRLRLEQKWGTAKFSPRANDRRDSGLLYHLGGPDQIWPQCLEFQIQEQDVGDIWLLSGAGLTAHLAPQVSAPTFSPLGNVEQLRNERLIKDGDFESLTDWNTVELVASGRDVAQIVNGHWVNAGSAVEATDAGIWGPLDHGRLALQAEGAEVFFRNVQLRPLVYAAPPPGAVVLFDGTGMGAWKSKSGSPPGWHIVDGALEVVPGKGDLVTQQAFGDVHLHVEFQVPPSPDSAAEQDRGNSGVYLQGRYEVQVLDSFGHSLAGANDCGAIYGVKDADVNEALPPGIWQSYDIVFHAPVWNGSTKQASARMTVVWNGSVVQRDVEVPHNTGLGDNEGPNPAPLRLQDHGHPVRFRNVWLVPL